MFLLQFVVIFSLIFGLLYSMVSPFNRTHILLPLTVLLTVLLFKHLTTGGSFEGFEGLDEYEEMMKAPGTVPSVPFESLSCEQLIKGAAQERMDVNLPPPIDIDEVKKPGIPLDIPVQPSDPNQPTNLIFATLPQIDVIARNLDEKTALNQTGRPVVVPGGVNAACVSKIYK